MSVVMPNGTAIDNVNASFDGITWNSTIIKAEVSGTYTWNITARDSLNLIDFESGSFNTGNTVPEKVDLHLPEDGNVTIVDKIITFDWSNTTDADGDPITYHIEIDEVSSDYQSPVINITNIAETANTTKYTTTTELDVDVNYTWHVRANDGTQSGEWSDNRTFMIPSQVILSLPTSSTNFGTLNVGDTEDTSDNNPEPLVIRNDGNVLTDVNISLGEGSTGLWSSKSSPSDYFKYKIDNKTGEEYSFNEATSQLAWQQVPLSNETAITQLNYTDTTDEAEIDFSVEVPLDEPSGDKTAYLIFTGWVSA
ncbi:MAG: hypothetical protein PHG05_00845 [Candidatus Nanoarchaeia archaeon]|nr:hypothetical protein [Candidatus Nanoarchaeia archaeon]